MPQELIEFMVSKGASIRFTEGNGQSMTITVEWKVAHITYSVSISTYYGYRDGLLDNLIEHLGLKKEEDEDASN